MPMAIGTKAVAGRTECPVCGLELIVIFTLKWHLGPDGVMHNVTSSDPRIVYDSHAACFADLPED